MAKFNKGDRVKCIDAGSNRSIKAGQVYTVKGEIGGMVELEEKSYTTYYAFRFELEKVHPFKAGDRITGKPGEYANIEGKTFTVKTADFTGNGKARVYLEGESSYDWWFAERFTLAASALKVGDRVECVNVPGVSRRNGEIATVRAIRDNGKCDVRTNDGTTLFGVTVKAVADTLKIGDRVRIISAPYLSELKGAQATVYSFAAGRFADGRANAVVTMLETVGNIARKGETVIALVEKVETPKGERIPAGTRVKVAADSPGHAGSTGTVVAWRPLTRGNGTDEGYYTLKHDNGQRCVGVWESYVSKLDPAFSVGDRVVRTGPHTLENGSYDYGNAECRVGSRGRVVTVWNRGSVSVKWDSGRSSAITPSSLTLEAVYDRENPKPKVEPLAAWERELYAAAAEPVAPVAKFKVGDRVTGKSADGYPSKPLTGTITQVGGTSSRERVYGVAFDGYRYTRVTRSESELKAAAPEAAALKVGDKVRIISAPYLPELKGKTGTVSSLNIGSFKPEQANCRVKIDNGGTPYAFVEKLPQVDPVEKARIEARKRLGKIEKLQRLASELGYTVTANAA